MTSANRRRETARDNPVRAILQRHGLIIERPRDRGGGWAGDGADKLTLIGPDCRSVTQLQQTGAVDHGDTVNIGSTGIRLCDTFPDNSLPTQIPADYVTVRVRVMVR